jgi:hypothetical protein
MAVEAAPAVVGPEPASREASSFVTFSISAVHCPASAVAMGKATKIQVPNINAVVLMVLLSRLRLRKAAPFGVCGVYDINRRNDPMFRAGRASGARLIGSLETDMWRSYNKAQTVYENACERFARRRR